MIRKWHLAVPLTILAMAAATAASAQPLRTAAVGDQIGSLVTGLTKVDAGPVGSCGEGAPAVGYVDSVVPGRQADDDHASFVGLTVGDRMVMLVAYDEEDLSTPVAVYADIDGHGTVTDVWPAVEAPGPCVILEQAHDHP